MIILIALIVSVIGLALYWHFSEKARIEAERKAVDERRAAEWNRKIAVWAAQTKESHKASKLKVSLDKNFKETKVPTDYKYPRTVSTDVINRYTTPSKNVSDYKGRRSTGSSRSYDNISDIGSGWSSSSYSSCDSGSSSSDSGGGSCGGGGD